MAIKISIKSMVVTAVITTLIIAIVGSCLGLFWFSSAAKPMIRTIRDASAWNNYFMILFGVGCAFSFGFTALMALIGRDKGLNKRVNWVVNLLITTVVGLILAAVLYIIAPNKNVNVTIVSSLLLFIQGAAIFFIASYKAPSSWVYNPFA